MIQLSPALQPHFSEDITGFAALMAVEGEVYREVKGRRTVAFERGGRGYFIKSHQGHRWGEVLKSLLSLQRPVLGAKPEWRGIEALEKIGLPTMTLAGKGERGWPSGAGGSFVVTEALEGMISLEELLEKRDSLVPRQRDRLKRALIDQLGQFSRKMHEGGVNHRDYYLCHFLTKDRDWQAWAPGDHLTLHLIDLHRVQLRARAPERWIVKDLGALMYSAFDADLTVMDAMRFVRAYLGGGADWKERYQKESKFWFRVVGRALGFQREWQRRQVYSGRAPTD